MKIQNSVALVTGANRGLGLAFATALVARGAKVYAAARDPRSVPALPGLVPVKLDVTNPADLGALVERTDDVTLVVNNAGIARPKSLLDPAVLASAREELETNTLGPLATIQAYAPVLARNGGGAIVNVLSALSWVTLPGLPAYSASKAAAWALTNALRGELRGQGTQVLALHVGFVDTDMARDVTEPKSKPEDVVRVALDALEAGEDEVLADDTSRFVKQGLSRGIYLGPVRA